METVLISGASRGLGLEFSKQYAAVGWRVLACARRPSPGLTALAAIQGSVSMLPLDVTNHVQVDQLAARLGGEAIDVLINNAGVIGKRGFGAGAIEEQAFGVSDYEEWERIFRTNVMAPMKMAEAFIENVARSRHRKIVNLTSVVGSMEMNTSGGLYAYRASKAAVNAITKSMAIDLQSRGIIPVAIHPGWVTTAMGGSNAPIGVRQSVAGMLRVIEQLSGDSAGSVLTYEGVRLPY